MSGSLSSVTNESVAEYRGMVEVHAARFCRLPEMQNDFDDFVQEGWEAVADCLADGLPPSSTAVTDNMRDWARKRRRQLHHQVELTDGETP